MNVVRPAIQITLILLLCLLGVWLCSHVIDTLAASGNEGLWQKGVWTIQDAVAQRINPIFMHAEGSRAPHLATVSVRTCADCPWAFSSLNSRELAGFLQRQYEAAGGDERRFIPLEATDSATVPDLHIQLEILELAGGTDEETLRCSLTVQGRNQPAEAHALEALCPLGHRSWFVRPRRVPSVYLYLAAGACVLGLICLGVGAWQAFVMEYAGAYRMWCGTIALVAGTGFLLTNWIFEPSIREIRVPSQQIDIVLETSDAVLFPMNMDGRDTQNPLARFMQSSVAHLSRELDGGLTDEGELSFWQWIHAELIEPVSKDQQGETLQLMSSVNMRVYRALPGRLDDPGAALEYIPIAELPAVLQCGHGGIETGFFLPWDAPQQVSLSAARSRLMLVFTTGEVGSSQEADRLQRDLERLCESKPDALRVFTIMVPSVPRSSELFESEDERLLRLSKMSDWLMSVNTSDITVAQRLGTCEVVSPLSLFACPILGKGHLAMWANPTDLDIQRVQLFGHQNHDTQAQTEEAAAQLAQQVSSKVVWERIPVFQLNQTVLWVFLAIAGLLLLFLSLQDELTLLEFQSEVPRGGLLGRTLGILLGLLGCLYLIYSLRNTSLWTIRGGRGLTLWAITWIWSCIFWLPYLVGRGSRQLAAPTSRLRTRRLFGCVMGAGTLLGGALGYGTFLRVHRGMAIRLPEPGGAGAGVCLDLLYASGVLLLLLNAWFLWNRFGRDRRTWTVGIGGFSALLLMLLPLWGTRWGTSSFLGYPFVFWIWLAAMGAPVLTCLILREAVRFGPRSNTWNLGWRWLVFLGLALPALVGLVYGPVPASSLEDFRGYWQTCLVAWLFPCLLMFLALLPKLLGEIGWLSHKRKH